MRRLPRTDLLLALACAAAAAMLAASQFTDMFHLTPPGGEALEAQTSQDQHGYAMLVLAIFSLFLLATSLAAPRSQIGSQGISLFQITTFGIAVCGVVALLLFLIVDLPDVNKIGTLDDDRESFIDAKAEPQAGFWLELIGSMVLAACGVALATMRAPNTKDGSADQLIGQGGTEVASSDDQVQTASQAARTKQIG